MRKIVQLNTEWYFEKTNILPVLMPDDWEKVTLPHTWNAIDGQDGGNDYYRGTCMYVRTLKKPNLEKNGRAVLEFQGAAMTAEIYVNGEKVACHEGGYSTFRVDITEKLKEENLICVSVDNSVNDRVYPQTADFTFYGGLYRNVNLILVSEYHFELLQDGTPGIKVTPQIEGNNAIVTAETWQNRDGKVCFTMETSEGKTVQAEAISKNGYAKTEFILENVHLWDGVKDPFLYKMKAELVVETEDMYGITTDVICTRFGCRKFDFDKEKGFLLNGRVYPLRGVSRHQDRLGVGNALTPEMHREDMEIIKEIGANTIRLAHYQQDQYFYDLCDEYGMIVWAEIPYITRHMPNGRENTISQMRELVTQCYNHPSIVCWGLSNEITASGSVTEDMLENHRLLNDLCHKMDKTRFTTMAHVFMLETDSPIIEIADVGNYNLYFGWYLGELEQNAVFFDEYHKKFPKRVIGFSEYGADANIQFQTAKPERGDYSEQYQAVYHEYILQCIEKRPYLWATYVWNMFDFAADGRDEGGSHGRNQKGLVTIDRRLKKDAFYLYKAAWSEEPFVHICGRRYVERTEDVTEIKVYSNQPEVTLWVDGKEQERQSGNRIFVFNIPITGVHDIKVTAGTCEEYMQIKKVKDQNPEYIFQKETVVNWFDKEKINPAYFSIQDTMGAVMANQESAALLEKVIARASASRGEVAQSTSRNENLQKMMACMTIQNILKQAGDVVSKEMIKELNEALQKIKK